MNEIIRKRFQDQNMLLEDKPIDKKIGQRFMKDHRCDLCERPR